ncbi:MAG: hypothetical protein QXJ51_01680 [Sulfolobales archaeon]
MLKRSDLSRRRNIFNCNIRWDQEYKYSYVKGPIISRDHVELIYQAFLKGLRSIEISLDLGLSKSLIEIRGENISIEGFELSIGFLREYVEEGFLYKLIGGRIQRIDLYDNGRYYKLKPVGIDKAPTIEINGIQMHRTVGVDPWKDSLLKVLSLGRLKGLRVLDICTGLGYTAINILRRGSGEVISIEADKNVLNIASMNPWSQDLEKVRILLGDAVEVVSRIDDECFHAILHDPPRINIAGELYSESFYKELYRILSRGGRLFHYTGEPGRHSNISILKGIKRRLEKAGFTEVRWVDKAKGFLSIKP